MLEKKRSILLSSFLLLALFLSISVKVSGQSGNSRIKTLDDTAILNLKSAVNSDNAGLRRSGIYLSGKYSVQELSETLVNQLEKETEPEIRILIARVLFIIDDEKFIDDIYNLSLNDKNPKVKRMASAIHSVIQIKNSENVAQINK